jgi:beta-lactamase regulating signal transducer with metallopeptidase domain
MFENWQNYLIQTNLFLALFYGLYWLLLRHETFFQSNRLYLLLSSWLAILIPLLPSPDFVQDTQVVQNLREINPLPPTVSYQPAQNTPINQVVEIHWQLTDYLLLIYFIGVMLLAIRFFLSLFLILRLAFRHHIQRKGRVFWVELPPDNPSFSFLNILFWGSPSKLTDAEKQQILAHELVHIRQWHSLDILLSEVLIIFFWYNPLAWFYQKSLRKLHEYLADSTLIKQGIDKSEYAQLLVSQALLKENLNLSNTFYSQKLLKSRIMKLNQLPSQNWLQLKFMLFVPILFSTFLIGACSREKVAELNPLAKNQMDLPPGYQSLNTYAVNEKSPQKIQFIFKEGIDYLFTFYVFNENLDKKFEAKLYEKGGKNGEQKILKLGIYNLANRKQRMNFRCEKTTTYVLEISAKDSQQEILMNISTFKPEKLEASTNLKADDLIPYNQRLEYKKKIQKLTIQNGSKHHFQLEKGHTYSLSIGSLDGRVFNLADLDGVLVTINDSKGNMLTTNYIHLKSTPEMSFNCPETGTYEIIFDIEPKDKKAVFHLMEYVKSSE